MDRVKLYDIMYALAARDGREAALFGNCAAAAREAFTRSLVGETFPEVWFELPLSGEPWFDFHALVSYKDIAGTPARFAGHGGAYADAIAWFAGQQPKKVRQLALSYDTSEGNVDRPAVQLLVDGRDITVPIGFLEAVGRSDLVDAYRTFRERMPHEWYACYAGVFPGRASSEADPWVRVECIVGDECQQAYAEGDTVLREHLARVGLEDMAEEAVPDIQELARSPFPLEFQFNVGAKGVASPVLSASVRFQPKHWVDEGLRGNIVRLMLCVQSRGLADDRWKLLANVPYAKSVDYEDEHVKFSCYPAFVKLRWRQGHSPDAKVYFIGLAE